MGNAGTRVKYDADTYTPNEVAKLLAESKESETEHMEAVRQSLIRLSSRGLSEVAFTLEDLKKTEEAIINTDYQQYEFPFENLVFEGGGAKGQAYVGCLRVLDELGIKPKRLAGTSAGAIVATLLAVGYTTEELDELMQVDLQGTLEDHTCGICSLLPNLFRYFGWNPADRFLEYMGDLISKKLGNKDLTFKELYDIRRVELCVTAVNINMSTVEYFHPKTAPDMPVRLAVRMSISIPGFFQAIKMDNGLGEQDIFVDGGVLCNYPIHVFDGWWLSMDPSDSFLNRIQPISQAHKLVDHKARFWEYNEKTLGFIVYSTMTQEVMVPEIESRIGLTMAQRPEESKLYQSRAEKIQSKAGALKDYQIFLRALDKFMMALREANEKGDESDDVITKEELAEVLKIAAQNTDILKEINGSEEATVKKHDINFLTAAHIEIVFGRGYTLDTVFEKLDVSKNGLVTYDEILRCVERLGINMKARFLGYNRQDINSLKDYAQALKDCLFLNAQKIFLQERDVNRTIGVNTDYILTTDFDMEPADKEFLIQQGRNATIAFLKNFVFMNQPPKKKLDAV